MTLAYAYAICVINSPGKNTSNTTESSCLWPRPIRFLLAQMGLTILEFLFSVIFSSAQHASESSPSLIHHYFFLLLFSCMATVCHCLARSCLTYPSSQGWSTGSLGTIKKASLYILVPGFCGHVFSSGWDKYLEKHYQANIIALYPWKKGFCQSCSPHLTRGTMPSVFSSLETSLRTFSALPSRKLGLSEMLWSKVLWSYILWCPLHGIMTSVYTYQWGRQCYHVLIGNWKVKATQGGWGKAFRFLTVWWMSLVVLTFTREHRVLGCTYLSERATPALLVCWIPSWGHYCYFS